MSMYSVLYNFLIITKLSDIPSELLGNFFIYLGIEKILYPKLNKKLDLYRKLLPEEETLWNDTIELEKDKYIFEGKIVKGFGRGGSVFMFPTGNIRCIYHSKYIP